MHSFSGVKGRDGNGDIMNCDNMEAFQTFVLNNTDNKGVSFVMADGVRTDVLIINIISQLAN